MLLLGLRSTSTTSIISTSAGGRARPPPNYSLFFFPNKFNKKTTLIPSCAPFSSRRKSNGNRREREDPDPETPPKLLVVQPRLRPQYRLRSKLNEALSLANSLQEQRRDNLLDSNNKMKMMPPHLLVQNPEEAHRSVRADMYFGSGTVADVKRYLRALQSDSDSDSQGQGGGLDAVFVNTILSGIQQRNLEMEWGKPVLDRVGLIIEIFHAHAHTKEAMLQSELAALMYKRSRLVRVRGPGGRLTFGTGGEAQVVSARGRGSGGRGFISGAGETELQLQRQRIQDRRTHLLSQVEEVRRTRFVQRSARKRHGGSHGQALATVAIVGYTNAGKSTLVSALSESDLYSDDRLFATVDPILRSVILPSGRKVLFSDTVGFISDLPVQLVEAFHATLEEVAEADLLVHVLDASAPDLDEQRATVLEVLQQIGVAEEKIQNMVEVWNKIDLLNKHIGVDETIEEDDFLSGDEGNDGTIAAEEYVSGVEEGEDEIYSEEECPNVGEVKEIETISRMECLSGDEEDGGFTSDQDKYGKASEEAIEGFQDRHAVSLEQQETNLNIAREARAIEHVETSAVMGIGLQELLNVIDEKLSAQKSVVTKHFGPFDRKWRPSYTTDSEKAA